MNLAVGQYVLIKPPTWSHPLFGKIERIILGLTPKPKPIVVYVDKFWGYNIKSKFVSENSKEIIDQETGHAMYGVYIDCSEDVLVQIDWYHDFYLKNVEHKRKAQIEVDLKKEPGKGRERMVGRDMRPVYQQEADLMAQTYNMIGVELAWAQQEGDYLEKVRSGQTYRDKKAAEKKKSIREAKTPFVKNDIVTVSNVNGYPGETFQAIVAAMGKGTIVEGQMIRDLVWNGVAGAYGINKRVDLGVTQALVFYTKDFPDKQIWDKVQWRYSGKTNFAKKVTLRL